MLAKMTRKNQLTLPKVLVGRLGKVEYFEVVAEGERIVLTPVRINPANKVREKLAELDITEADVADAITWARRGKE
jgi:hypothetical protein